LNAESTLRDTLSYSSTIQKEGDGKLKAPELFVKYLSESGYHPRSSKHGDKLCELLLADLMEECPAIRKAAQEGKICYNLNYSPGQGVPLGWNIDLAIGPPSSVEKRNTFPDGSPMKESPIELWIAMDAKTIMTEHGKARRNRQRDLNSFSSILHMKNPKTIVGGLVVINCAGSFRSPLRDGEMTIHANIERLVAESVKMFEDLPRAPSGGADPKNLNQIDAIGIIVLEYSNAMGEVAKLVTGSPAPQIGSPAHYNNFVKDICTAFLTRYV